MILEKKGIQYMDKKRIEIIKNKFDTAIHNIEDEQIEFWFARELMTLLGYERWENFENAILANSCINAVFISIETLIKLAND
jgi:hypothetical protein